MASSFAGEVGRSGLAGALAAAVAIPHAVALGRLTGLPAELVLLPSVGATLALAWRRSGPAIFAGAAALAAPFLTPLVQRWGIGAVLWASLWCALTMLFLDRMGFSIQARRFGQSTARAFVAGLGLLLVFQQMEPLLSSRRPLWAATTALLCALGLWALRSGYRLLGGASLLTSTLLCLRLDFTEVAAAVSFQNFFSTAREARTSALWLPDSALLPSILTGIGLGICLAAYQALVEKRLDPEAERGGLARLGWFNLAGSAFCLAPAAVMPARSLLARELEARSVAAAWAQAAATLLLVGLVGGAVVVPEPLLAGLILTLGIALIDPAELGRRIAEAPAWRRIGLLALTVAVPVLGPAPTAIALGVSLYWSGPRALHGEAPAAGLPAEGS
ncbi:MAG: hypothetical protein AAF690_15320 [Acidobacteriota bacterium]